MQMINFVVSLILLFNLPNDRDFYNSTRLHNQITSIDTIKIISDIKKRFLEINSAFYLYRKKEKNFQGKSVEGGTVISFYKGKELKKALITHFGETGKVETEYYFNAEELFFEYKREFFYDKPFYIQGSKVTSSKEHRFYFYNGKLIRWIGDENIRISPKSPKFKEEETRLNEDIRALKDILVL